MISRLQKYLFFAMLVASAVMAIVGEALTRARRSARKAMVSLSRNYRRILRRPADDVKMPRAQRGNRQLAQRRALPYEGLMPSPAHRPGACPH